MQAAISTQAALRAYEIDEYAAALRALDERSRYAPEQNDLLTLRAWSYFQLGQYSEAKLTLEAVAATGYADARLGLETVEDVLRARQQQP